MASGYAVALFLQNVAPLSSMAVTRDCTFETVHTNSPYAAHGLRAFHAAQCIGLLVILCSSNTTAIIMMDKRHDRIQLGFQASAESRM